MMMRILEAWVAPYVFVARLYLRAMWKLAGVREYGAVWWLVAGSVTWMMTDGYLDIQAKMLEGRGVAASIMWAALGSVCMGIYVHYVWRRQIERKAATTTGSALPWSRGYALVMCAMVGGPWLVAVLIGFTMLKVPDVWDLLGHLCAVVTFAIITGLAGDDNNRGEPYVATAIRKVFELGRGVSPAPVATVGVGR